MGPLLLSSSVYKYICRTGLVARAVVYWLIAGLMLKAALLSGEPENGMGPTDAFRSLETTHAGRLFLLSIGAGLLLYAGWRWTQAIFDVRSEGEDASGYLARGGMAMSGLSYASVAIAAITVTLGANAGGGPGMTEQALRWLLTMPFGRILVVLPGWRLLPLPARRSGGRLTGDGRMILQIMSGWTVRGRWSHSQSAAAVCYSVWSGCLLCLAVWRASRPMPMVWPRRWAGCGNSHLVSGSI
jgi:hypothetical protein